MRKFLLTLSYLVVFLAGFLLCYHLYSNMQERASLSVNPASIPIRIKGESPFVAAVAKAGPAVVNIDTTYKPSSLSPFGFLFGEETITPPVGKGSGVLIDPEGVILTNYHVIEGARSIKVTLIDGRQFNASVVGADPQSDIAVIRIKGTNLPYLRMGDSSQLRVGDWVIAIGNPFGLSNTATVGIVSALRKGPFAVEGRSLSVDTLIQTDAAINKGNSGGALVNLKGELVGLCTAILTPPLQEGNVGIGFAIAIDSVKKLIPQLLTKGKVAHPWFGIGYLTLTKEIKEGLGIPGEVEGVLIQRVFPRSPAEKAGVQPGDVVIEMDGQKIRTTEDVVRIMMEKEVGAPLTAKIWRGGKIINIKVKLGEMPPSL